MNEQRDQPKKKKKVDKFVTFVTFFLERSVCVVNCAFFLIEEHFQMLRIETIVKLMHNKYFLVSSCVSP
jgi:hypothetical protein